MQTMNSPERAPHRNGDIPHGVTVEHVSARIGEACGAVLAGRSTRSKRYCSAACRQRAHRERKEARAAERFAELLL